ncbi:unnamed protein product [Parnassius mnemosyne]|uniref:Ubiquitin-like protease family profile domain-containing protein n=1 Tax=Parnassius mnemosyne TaxID=213953 RepID=A0AAV1LS70_9NEOP
MRSHLLSIFRTNKLTHFPVISNENKGTLLDLSTIRKKERYALNYRCKRYGPSSSTVKKENSPSVCILKVPQHLVNDQITKFQMKDHSYVLDSTLNINLLINLINQGDKLIDEHIYHFKLMLESCSDYVHRDTLNLVRPERIEPVPKLKKHIQILFSQNGHWVCSFYDTKKVYVYDSLNSGSLHNDQKNFLQHLFPYLEISSESIIFPKVQFQVNGDDCGIFAIAFAVSLLFRRNPDDIIYDLSSM